MVGWIFSHFTRCVSEVKVVEEAASTGQLEILKYLLEKDSGHTQEEYEVGTANGGGNGVTWGGRDMELAVKNGHSDVVRWLLENTSEMCRVQGSVLIQAVLSGNLPTVQLLVARGFRVLDPHHLVEWAAYEGHLELLQWLVEENFLGEDRYVHLSSKHLDVNKWVVESGLEREVEETFKQACGVGPLAVVW
ncbi:putative ankyrin repeat protein L63 [Phytophthora citrophthora]|uniref:Ankyrin repeat protein L63 n=1 Tax=Phytophthora citrophthora TaxID=4793 RepID=A0AAD9GXV6_9STRA|nr:putative ankyrin repeat protein L63 [Phytophthora citrophthora]